MLHYIKVAVKLIWGFTSKELVSSKTRESYLVPPPTTLIGALSFGYAKLNKIPEEDLDLSSAERIRKMILSVHERVIAPLIQYSDISKIRWYDNRSRIAKYDAVAFGKSYKGVSKNKHDLEVIYVVKDSDQARIIASAAHSLIRIGGSHGLASVEEVETGLLSCDVTNNEVITRYSFWNDLVLNALPTDILVQDVVDYRRTSIGNYMGAPLRRRAYPYSKTLMSPMEVNVKIDSRRAMVCTEGEEVLVIER